MPSHRQDWLTWYTLIPSCAANVYPTLDLSDLLAPTPQSVANVRILTTGRHYALKFFKIVHLFSWRGRVYVGIKHATSCWCIGWT